eukprot:m.308173 g.308173  ORF g.308173 m.308173 type:complete len:63 (+) comp43496_c0_seq1:2719-2907(+)
MFCDVHFFSESLQTLLCVFIFSVCVLFFAKILKFLLFKLYFRASLIVMTLKAFHFPRNVSEI